MPMFKVKRPSILSRTASVKAHAPAGASAASSAASQRQLSEIAEQRAQQQQQHEKTLRIVEEAHQEALRVEKAAHIEAIRIEKAVHQGLQEDVLEASRSIDALVAEVAELRAQLEVAEEARRRAEATAAISRAEIGTAEAAVGAAEAAAAAADVSRKQAQAEAARIAIAARAATTLVSRDASVVSSARRAGPNEEITFLAPRALLPPPSAAAPPVEPAVDSHPAVLVEPDVPTAEHGFVLPPLQTTLTEWEMIFEDQRVTWLKYFMVTGQYAEAMELVVSDAEAAAVHEFRSRPALKRAVERNLGLAIPSHTAPSGPAEGRPPSPRVSLVHTRAMPGYAASVSASRAANEAVPSRIDMDQTQSVDRAVVFHPGLKGGFTVLNLRTNRDIPIQGHSLEAVTFSGAYAYGVFRGTNNMGVFELSTGHPSVFELPLQGKSISIDEREGLIIVQHTGNEGTFTVLDAESPTPQNAIVKRDVFLTGLFDQEISR